ncbi:hypothetical protein ABPG74_008568 [Tetrahymena malaccensis]
MDFQQAQQFEFQMSKKKQTKGRRKYKRNIKKAIEVSHQQQTQLADGYYEVESIQKIRSFGKYDLKFYIKWKGWNENDNTWEPFQNVRNCYFNLKEYYDKYIDNKKMTSSDAWKTFVGCLRRENLLDEKGKFVETIKRKYNKKKVIFNNIEDNGDRSDSSENKFSKDKEETSNESSITKTQHANLKLEDNQDESNSNIKNQDKIKRERDANKLRKKITKRKRKIIQYDSQRNNDDGGEEDKADKTIEKKKRKQYAKRKSQNGQFQDESGLSMKLKPLKRTYSSTQSKKLKRNNNSNDLQQQQQIQIQQQDIDLKLEDEENREGIFKEFVTNSIATSNEQKDNSMIKNKNQLSEDASKRDTSKDTHQKYNSSNSQIESQNQLKEKEANSGSNLSDDKKQLKNQSNDSSDEEEEEGDEEEEEEEEQQDGQEEDEDEEEDLEEGQDEEEKDEENSNNIAASSENQLEKKNSLNNKRDFAQLSNPNQLDGSELESKLLKKRKKDTNELNSTHILLEQKEVLTSIQDLEHLQQQDREFNHNRYLNAENNLFGSNNNLDPELLHNEAPFGKKFNRIINREYQIEDGSISGGNGPLKNQIINSFDNFNNRDQINSEQYLDKQSPTGLSNIHFSDQQRNLQLRNSISHQSYFNKKIFWTDTVIPQEMIQSCQEQQQGNNTGGSAIQRIIQDQNQAKYFEDSQYNQLLQTYSQSFPNMENQLFSTKIDLNNKKLINGNSPIITIEDDEEEIVENSELQYKLHNERDDKDKFTKIRLVKKHDSVEIQDSQPYKHHNQYLDELQQKRIRNSNYNDIQGQLGGLSKSLHELSQFNQPQIKNKYHKYKKEIIQQNNKNGIQKQNSNPNINNNGSQNNIPQFNDQTYEQFIMSQFQEVKHLKNPEIKDPKQSIKSLYEGNLSLKDEPNRIIAMDIHPYFIGQYIFKVTWAPRKKKEQLLSSWVEGDKLKLKYPNLVFEFYESFIRFID